MNGVINQRKVTNNLWGVLRNMKIVVNEQVIDDKDIEDIQFVIPAKYHVADMEPFVVITLKNGKTIYASGETYIFYGAKGVMLR